MSARRDEIREAPIGCAVLFFDLLAEKMEGLQDFGARFIRVKFDVISHAISREKSVSRLQFKQFLFDDFVQQFLGVDKQFARFFAVLYKKQKRKKHTAQFP